MVIERFEELKSLYNIIVEEGEVNPDRLLGIGEMVADIEELIEENELYYRVNQLTNMLNILEKNIYDAVIGR